MNYLSFRFVTAWALGIALATGASEALAGRIVNVTANSNSALQSAMTNAQPGDTIILNGTYTVGVTTRVDGTSAAPITVEAGAGGATITTTSTSGDGIACGNDWYVFQGLAINGFQKSVRIDNASNGILNHLTCTNSANESVKLKNDSQFWLVENTSVSHSGMEGYYVGDADQNWEQSPLPDTSGFVTFYKDTAFQTGNDGFDFKEGTHDIKIINASVDWNNTDPGAVNQEGNSGVYDRANNLQVVNLTAKNNASDGDGVRADHHLGTDGVTYGTNTQIYGLVGNNLNGWMVRTDDGNLNTRLYTNYSMTDVTNGLLETGSSTLSMLSPSAFVEETWNGIGGQAFLPEPASLAVLALGITPLLRRRRR